MDGSRPANHRASYNRPAKLLAQTSKEGFPRVGGIELTSIVAKEKLPQERFTRPSPMNGHTRAYDLPRRARLGDLN